MPFILEAFKVVFAGLIAMGLIALATISDPAPEPTPTAPRHENFVSLQDAETPAPETNAPDEPLEPPRQGANEDDEKEKTPRAPRQLAKVASSVEPERFPTDEAYAELNSRVRSASVNILCQMRDGRTIRSTTGSGVIIDPRGVILTNAHVAQFFLLADYPKKGATTCDIRIGNPARTAYKAELVYLPPVWVAEHAADVLDTSPRGTGENDFAFLRITESLNNDESLPSSFPFLPLSTRENVVAQDEDLIAASYPAFVGTREGIVSNLYLVSSLVKASTLYTFDRTTLDLFSMKGTVLSYRGASGGAVANTRGEIVGVIVASTNDTLVLDRELRALTGAHIDRHLQTFNNTTVRGLLGGDLAETARVFNDTAAAPLSAALARELENNR